MSLTKLDLTFLIKMERSEIDEKSLGEKLVPFPDFEFGEWEFQCNGYNIKKCEQNKYRQIYH